MSEASEEVAGLDPVADSTSGHGPIEDQIRAMGLDQAPRVTPDDIEALMDRVACVGSVIPGTTSTVLHAFLDEKFYLATAHSACVSEENFSEEVGIQAAQDKLIPMAREKLWELEGYRLYMALQDIAQMSGEAESEEQSSPDLEA